MRGVIAVIDDNELTRLLAGDALRELDYEPVLYSSCAEALAELQWRTPAACVVDHCMPGMTGAEFVRALRASPDARLRDLPIVALTTQFEWEMRESGADAFLRKPLKVPALGAALSRVIRPAGRP
jgi:two-component system chemotaxis response regulator CheY